MAVNKHAALDAIVVGGGLNGLSAAITLARAGRSVRVYEAQETIGGSARSMPLTLPGFTHDWGATVHALVLASPFFQSVPLQEFGVELLHPPTPFAHPLSNGTAVSVYRSVDETAEQLGAHDARAYRKLIMPFVKRADELMDALLAPIGFKHPGLMARFAFRAVQPVVEFATRTFKTDAARAIFAGAAAHSMLSLGELATTGYALGLIITAHAYGWPVMRGGTQQLTNALVAYLRSMGGEVITSTRVRALSELPDSRAILCDVSPRQLLQLCGDNVPSHYRRSMQRFKHGAGAFKMDWALSEQTPWRDGASALAGTVHVGGTLDEIATSERAVAEGRHADKPFVLTVQATPFDSTRAPASKHTLWGYCHVPNGSATNMQERMESQIERFAPGFRDCIIARHTLTPAALEQGNANLIGGDIGGGAGNLLQIIGRPLLARDPYATAVEGVYLCSSSTPPGIGVHGMSGFHAAISALKKSLDLKRD